MTGSTLFTLSLGTLLSSIVSSAHAEGGGPTAPATSQEESAQRTNAMKISVKVQDKVITATLVDNATSRDFVSLLPISLTLEDYAATEKISNLPRRLSTEGAHAGSEKSLKALPTSCEDRHCGSLSMKGNVSGSFNSSIRPHPRFEPR